MDDLADRHAGMAEQAVIFTRRHNWLMCWLYLGTFGSFIGFSASLPMLAQSQFQRADALHLVWLGPLIGAVLRPLGGWMADRWGGARVTFWVFVLMALAALALCCSCRRERLGQGSATASPASSRPSVSCSRRRASATAAPSG
jgi:NNP family nitrate/nitrite transporter-like MFS transporter